MSKLPPETAETFVLHVPYQAKGQRLDQYLASALPQQSRMRLKALINDGLVTIDGVQAEEPSQKVGAGQKISITIPHARESKLEAQAIPFHVYYEDQDLLVLEKPAGVVVHPAVGHADHTLVNALMAHCGDSLSGVGGVRRPGIVHRLDKDTTGVMVVAKHDAVHQHLSEQFKAHSIERTYLALCWGYPKQTQGRIETQIGRHPKNRQKQAVLKHGGKLAITDYKVVEVLAGGLISVIACTLHTGRTHQVRVHMTHLGHPLVGDETYGRSRVAQVQNEAWKEALSCIKRQALHAHVLGFVHPRTNETMRFVSELPEDMAKPILALKTS